jgi:hypothetical protein
VPDAAGNAKEDADAQIVELTNKMIQPVEAQPKNEALLDPLKPNNDSVIAFYGITMRAPLRDARGQIRWKVRITYRTRCK